MRIQFPENFLWGTSTAAAQIETATEHNWKGMPSKDGYTFGRTIDHEKRREEDVAYIKQFGTIYRCGVDWARLQDAPMAKFNQEVVDEYKRFFKSLQDEGMQIMFVIHHFTNPLWFEKNGSWLNEDNIPAFVNYAEQCIQHFSSDTFLWNTFNEPNVYAMNAFMTGNFPPQQKSYFKATRVIKNMGKAHDIVYKLLKADDETKQVGISQNTAYFEGRGLLGYLPAKFVDWWFNIFSPEQFKQLDFWGISYYAHIPFTPFPITEIDNPGELAKMNLPHDKMWAYYPEGLGVILRRFHKRYNKPIIITENGVCTADDNVRIQSLKDYLKVCHDAINDGVKLQGYIHWSTFDNFEWHLGPTYRFGLVEVNMETMDRKMTKAGEYYTKITQENAIEI